MRIRTTFFCVATVSVVFCSFVPCGVIAGPVLTT